MITSSALRARTTAARGSVVLAACVVLAATLTGCVSDADTPPPVQLSSAAALEGPAGPTPSDDTDVNVEADSGQPPAVLQEIRTVALDRIDRVVLVFAGSFDGYTVGYVNSVAATVGGKTRTIRPADLGGTAMLRIKVRNATTGAGTNTATKDAADTGPDPTPFAGPTSTSVGLEQITGYAIVADTGSDLTLAVGLAQRKPFIVLELAGPARLNVEIARP